jgi:hypothetical protein
MIFDSGKTEAVGVFVTPSTDIREVNGSNLSRDTFSD